MEKATVDLSQFGYLHITTISPEVKVGDVNWNTNQIISGANQAYKEGAALTVFPELSITGYTCGDLFQQDILIKKAWGALFVIASHVEGVVIVGLPLRHEGILYNCGAVIANKKIIGIVPKSHMPNYAEFYDDRWFSPLLQTNCFIEDGDYPIPFGTDIMFHYDDNRLTKFNFGIEICEDLWAPIPPSSHLALNGADVLINLSASNELVGKSDYRRRLVTSQSAQTICAYLYCSAGVTESTTDVVFSGHSMVAENGTMIAESTRFKRGTNTTHAHIDLNLIQIEKAHNKTFAKQAIQETRMYRKLRIELKQNPNVASKLFRKVNENPFIPETKVAQTATAREIFNIQAHGLATRLQHTGIKKIVLGLSGGLDSTLAFLVAIFALRLLGLPIANLIVVTMPGFGTTKRTRGNAEKLATAFGLTLRTIPIVKGATQVLSDINHQTTTDNTYENAQARYRMLLLLNLANKENAMVLGTGDLSELILGWCTFGGDHTTPYNVNGSLVKTLVKHVVLYAATLFKKHQKVVITQAAHEAPAHELQKGVKGKPAPSTEDLIGPYALHDFFISYTVRRRFAPSKVFFLATYAFKGKYTPDEIRKWYTLMLQRLFSQQFKRSILPDGPQVGSLSLSPRGVWRMPSDASAAVWLEDLKGATIIA